MAYVDCDSHILPEDAFDDVPEKFRQEGPAHRNRLQGRFRALFIRRANETFPTMRGPSQIHLTQDRARPAISRKFASRIWPKPRSIFKFWCRAMVPFITMSNRSSRAVCRSYNNAIGRMVKKYPGKFLGLATLPMQSAETRGGRVGLAPCANRACGRGLLHHRQ